MIQSTQCIFHSARNESIFTGYEGSPSVSSHLNNTRNPNVKINFSNDAVFVLKQSEFFYHTWIKCIYVHYNDIIMCAMVSQITCVLIVCSAICSGADQRNHQTSASLSFLMGIHRSQRASDTEKVTI